MAGTKPAMGEKQGKTKSPKREKGKKKSKNILKKCLENMRFGHLGMAEATVKIGRESAGMVAATKIK